MQIAFPNETAEYRAAREKLLNQEIALRREMEALAAARRALPPGGLIREDYVFDAMGAGGAPVQVKLSELFAPGKDSLILYNMMFPRHANDQRAAPASGPAAELPKAMTPCPSCVAFLDQLDGVARHVTQTLNFAVVAKAPIGTLTAFGADRGWRFLKLLSSGGNSFKRDYCAEDDKGQQQPMTTVFHRRSDGIRHFWSTELLYAPPDPGQDPRHAGTLEPLWNLMDLTADGRPQNWHEQFQYDCCH